LPQGVIKSNTEPIFLIRFRRKAPIKLRLNTIKKKILSLLEGKTHSCSNKYIGDKV